MRNFLFCATLPATAASTDATSQTHNDKPEDPIAYLEHVSSIYYSTPRISFWILEDHPELPLGYTLGDEETDQVDFNHCPGGEIVERIERTRLTPAGDGVDCRSVPNLEQPPIGTTLALSWKYLPGDNAFLVQNLSNGAPTKRIRCIDVPKSLLLAAKISSSGSSAIVHEENFTATSFDFPHDVAKVVASDGDYDFSCDIAASFWTIPAVDIKGTPFTAVTVTAPR